VCFLDADGYETFVDATYENGEILPVQGAFLPKDAEISTIQFWHEGSQVTVLPTGHDEDGTPLYQTVEMLLESGSLPEFTARSLARRVKAQPYRVHPKVAIAPLLKLPQVTQLAPIQTT